MQRHNFVRPIHSGGAFARSLAAAAALCAALVSPDARAARSVRDGAVFDGVPAIGAPVTAAVQRYAGGSEARFLDWLSDGGMLVARRLQGRDQILRLTAPDAEPQRLITTGDGAGGGQLGAAAAPAYSSDWLAYLQAEPDGGGAALYLAPLSGGTARRLVDAAGHPGNPVWAHDGRRLAFSATLREGHRADLYVIDASDSAAPPRLVVSGDAGAWQVLGWTSTDRALLVRRSDSALGDELLLADIDSGAIHPIEAQLERKATYTQVPEARLANDGRGVYLLTDRGSDYTELRYVDLYDGSVRVLSAPTPHAIEHFDVSADGHAYAYSWTENGYSRITLAEIRHTAGDQAAAGETAVATSAPQGLPSGIVAGLRFDRGGTRLAIDVAAAVAPRDVYVLSVASHATQRWTRSDPGAVSTAQLVAPQTLRFPTWDRPNGRARVLTALLYRAPGAAPHPALVMISDGPVRAQLDPFAQVCVAELGMTVIMPELRRDEAGALDFGALLAWIGAQPDLQRNRTLVLGRGTGGTLGVTALGLYGDRLLAAIDIDGAADSEQLAKVRQPVLLIRGLESPPLNAGSAEQLLWRLRSANVESWLVAPREVQGSLAGPEALSVTRQVMAQFLVDRLGG